MNKESFKGGVLIKLYLKRAGLLILSKKVEWKSVINNKFKLLVDLFKIYKKGIGLAETPLIE